VPHPIFVRTHGEGPRGPAFLLGITLKHFARQVVTHHHGPNKVGTINSHADWARWGRTRRSLGWTARGQDVFQDMRNPTLLLCITSIVGHEHRRNF